MLFNSFRSIIYFLNNKHLYFDTTAVLSGGFEGFIQRCSAPFDNRDKKIYIPFAVIKELSDKIKDPQDEFNYRAKKALEVISKYKDMNLLEITGSNTENDSSKQQLVRIAVKYRSNKELVFVTRNSTLAKDLIFQNNIKSYKGNRICVFDLDDRGLFTDYEEEKKQCAKSTPKDNFDDKSRDILKSFGLL